MPYIADLHIHSPYSRATSKASNLHGLSTWARIKGIHLVGSGDFTHPAWFASLKEQLREAEPGFFRLKEKHDFQEDGMSPEPIEVRFMLSAEISSIYKRGGKVRKIHNLLYVPSFSDAARINARLAAIGNIESDGRPILGLDSRDLLEIVLESSKHGFLVPAHIWTPWFSLFGSKSGFDTVEECFGDLSHHIFALETGLSSDPAMNRLLSQLDRFSLISNSDCHSPAKLGREANFFDTGFDFFSLRHALSEPDGKSFGGTIEFFPEEGKYHFDGHRKCGVCFNPEESLLHANLCPVCGKLMTIGVHNRVLELADRTAPLYPFAPTPFKSLIPLPEVLGEIHKRGPSSKLVMNHYRGLINRFGSEFNILLKAPVEELAGQSTLLGEAILRMRQGDVIRQPGYDGEFGVIRVFEEGETDRLGGQTTLFAVPQKKITQPSAREQKTISRVDGQKEATAERFKKGGLNPEQRQACESKARHILVTAGPGTGKTHTLVQRLLHLLEARAMEASHIVVITFTNKAAEEIRERLAHQRPRQAEAVFIGTFHAFCLSWLRKSRSELKVIGPDEKWVLLRRLFPDLNKGQLQDLDEACADFFENRQGDARTLPNERIGLYLAALEKRQLIDLDAIIPSFLDAIKNEAPLAEQLGQGIGALLIDEFQDINQAQFELTLHFASHAEIFAIGDPDQSIYGFRGSDPRFFHQFAKAELNGNRVLNVSLTRNYRNAPLLLNAAGQLIANNKARTDSPLIAHQAGEALLEYHQAPSPAGEAQYIVQRIEEIVGGISHFSINSGRGGSQGRGKSFADIAVLFRLNQQATAIRDGLEQRGIPCQLVGLPPFFMGGDLRLVSFWILSLADLATTGAYLQLFAALSGIGRGALRKLEDAAFTGHDLASPEISLLVDGAARQNLHAFLTRLARLRQENGQWEIVELARQGMGLLAVDADSPEAARFLRLAGSFGTGLTAFGRHLQSNAKATLYDDKAEAITLLSMHAAKGLEFDTVFIAGCEEGLTPNSFGKESWDSEEERRLFYVAMTRAREQLILTSCRQRQLHGRTVALPPSRFLSELPQSSLTVDKRNFTPRKPAARQLSLFS